MFYINVFEFLYCIYYCIKMIMKYNCIRKGNKDILFVKLERKNVLY